MTLIKRNLVFVALALGVLVSGGCGDDQHTSTPSPPEEERPPPPGVSSLDYSPKRISKDMTKMTVHFTTTGPAGPGLEYTAWLFTGENSDRDQDCWSEFGARDAVPGEAGKTYEQVVELTEREGTHVEDPWHACIGPAKLVVWTQPVEDRGNSIESLKTTTFEILPPR